MKRALPFLLVVVGLAVVGLGYIAFSGGPEWTAASPEAVAEYNAFNDARARVYMSEAAAHLERALELDPEFVMAKMEMALDNGFGSHDPEERERMLDEVREADLERLTERERFLVSFTLARVDGDQDLADSLLDARLENHPKDFYALYVKAALVWGAGDLEAAEGLLRQVIEINPNWVLAHNLLGYIGMEVGRFAEAEQHFRTYRFVAPEQANPHDSLGELLTLIGRYDEAVEEFEAALAVRGDFWASFSHLMAVYLYQHDWESAQAVADRVLAQEGHPEWMDETMGCVVEVNRMGHEQGWERVLEIVETRCTTDRSRRSLRAQIHRAACLVGDFELAIQKEEELAKLLDELNEVQHQEASFGSALYEHLVAVRLAVSGDVEGAVDRLRAADKIARFRGDGEGIFKLWNRLCLIAVLERTGRVEEAETVLQSVRKVNPILADRCLDEVEAVLGLD